uniref:Uncharacterized protein n=1 Tax=Siphoviridae sp. ctnsL8 TaxID=2825666 RepID=A0A8S5PQ47_9CAUD|nr:MAG TPA: hypothetical protein [Siphoviridae sp. ctnsL8]
MYKYKLHRTDTQGGNDNHSDPNGITTTRKENFGNKVLFLVYR